MGSSSREGPSFLSKTGALSRRTTYLPRPEKEVLRLTENPETYLRFPVSFGPLSVLLSWEATSRPEILLPGS